MSPSGTELSAEITRMISTQHAYEANAQVVRTSDAMLGTLLDIKA
jgi:flagellar basal-body rod protein FlgC